MLYMCEMFDIIVHGRLIHCPEIDHSSNDFVVSAVSTNKGTGGSDLEA